MIRGLSRRLRLRRGGDHVITVPVPSERSASIDRSRLDRMGFDVVHLLRPDQVAAVSGVLTEAGVDGSEPFFASPAHAWGDRAAWIHERLSALLADRLAEVLPDHRVFMIAVTAKGRHGSPIKFHHDWTYTDERRHRPVFLWCPLVDCDPSTGSLKVVPGSHRWSSGIRPSRRLEVTELHQEDYERLSVGPAVPAGDAIVFDPAVIHGSGPNPLAHARPAITIAMAPRGADLVHFHELDDGSIAGFAVDEPFFTTNPYGQRPQGYASYAAWTGPVTADELAAGIATGTGGRTKVTRR